MIDRPGLRLLAIAAVLSACAAPPVVMISPDYAPGHVKRVAVTAFDDFPGSAGSGALAADAFEKYLLWAGYGLVERRQVQRILAEQSLQSSGDIDPATIKKIGKILGVDALVLGSVTDFAAAQQETVMVDQPQEIADPLYGTVTTVRRDHGSVVKSVHQVVTGYSYTEVDQTVPETQTEPAHAALSVRLVDVETGEVLWLGSAAGAGADLNAALEQDSARIMRAIVKKLKTG